MTKQKRLVLIPLIIIAAMLIYCWGIILTTEILATWRQYIGLLLFFILAFLFLKNIVAAIISTGLYLLLATFNLLAMTPTITVSGIRIGAISTPPVQLISLGLFILYFCLNMDSLIDIYLDYKEASVVTVERKKD
ncbi:MAG: hypothetical protein ABJB11_06935 [Ferruginibacter sp.]